MCRTIYVIRSTTKHDEFVSENYNPEWQEFSNCKIFNKYQNAKKSVEQRCLHTNKYPHDYEIIAIDITSPK